MSVNLNKLRVQQVAIREIKLNKTNRDEGDLDGLADSMKQYGLINPILVCNDSIIAGQRRFLAAKQLGWSVIDCKRVPEETTQEELNELTAIENLQRKDLTVWEEAEQLARIEKKSEEKRTLEDLASHLGKSTTWVAQRRAINKAVPELRKLAEKYNWPIKVIELISRMDAGIQTTLIKDLCRCDRDHIDPRNVQRLLKNYMRRLGSATWNLDDAELYPKAGACTTCPKRSSQAAALFPEITKEKDDTCLDAFCWEAKGAALIQLSITKLTDEGHKPLLIGSSYNLDGPAKKVVGNQEMISEYSVDVVNKPKEGYVPAVVVTGDKAGTTVYVKKDGSARRESKIDQETGKPKPKSNAERLTTLRQKRMCLAAELWIKALDKQQPGYHPVVWLASVFGTNRNKRFRGDLAWKSAIAKGHKDNDIAKRLWDEVKPVLKDRAKRYGTLLDAAAIFAEITGQAEAIAATTVLRKCWEQAVTEIPLPKTLAKAGVKDQVKLP